MRLMDRYILREYLTPVGYCLGTFTMFYVIWDLFANLGEIIEAKTPVLLIGRYYLCLVLPTLEFLAPASLLLATLYTLWHLTRNNELTAMRSSGVSLYRIMVPFLAVGMVFSIVTGVVKESIGPEAARWAWPTVPNRPRPMGSLPPAALASAARKRSHRKRPEAALWALANARRMSRTRSLRSAACASDDHR